jgi:hypothetical protein
MGTLTVDLSAVDVAVLEGPRHVTALFQNSPNPFSPNTKIRYSVAEAGPIEVSIYDVRGRLVSNILSGRVPAGEHAILWNGTNERGRHVAAGIYYYVLRTGDSELRRKMVLIR